MLVIAAATLVALMVLTAGVVVFVAHEDYCGAHQDVY